MIQDDLTIYLTYFNIRFKMMIPPSKHKTCEFGTSGSTFSTLASKSKKRAWSSLPDGSTPPPSCNLSVWLPSHLQRKTVFIHEKKGEFMMDLIIKQWSISVYHLNIYIYIFMSIIWQFVVRTRWKLFVTTQVVYPSVSNYITIMPTLVVWQWSTLYPRFPR